MRDEGGRSEGRGRHGQGPEGQHTRLTLPGVLAVEVEEKSASKTGSFLPTITKRDMGDACGGRDMLPVRGCKGKST